MLRALNIDVYLNQKLHNQPLNSFLLYIFICLQWFHVQMDHIQKYITVNHNILYNHNHNALQQQIKLKPNQTWQAKVFLYVLQLSSYAERTRMWHKQIKAIVISMTL